MFLVLVAQLEAIIGGGLNNSGPHRLMYLSLCSSNCWDRLGLPGGVEEVLEGVCHWGQVWGFQKAAIVPPGRSLPHACGFRCELSVLPPTMPSFSHHKLTLQPLAKLHSLVSCLGNGVVSQH